jgi:hypothetical protein
MFERWRQRGESKRLQAELQKLRGDLLSESTDRYEAACKLVDLGDDAGAGVLGEWLRGARDNDSHTIGGNRYHPSVSVAATGLGKLVARGSSRAQEELISSLLLIPAPNYGAHDGRKCAVQELKKLGLQPTNGTRAHFGFLLGSGDYEALAQEYPDQSTATVLTAEAENYWGCGYHKEGIYALRHFPTPYVIEKLTVFMSISYPIEKVGRHDVELVYSRQQALAALHELAGSPWDESIANLVLCVVLPRLKSNDWFSDNSNKEKLRFALIRWEQYLERGRGNRRA